MQYFKLIVQVSMHNALLKQMSYPVFTIPYKCADELPAKNVLEQTLNDMLETGKLADYIPVLVEPAMESSTGFIKCSLTIMDVIAVDEAEFKWYGGPITNAVSERGIPLLTRTPADKPILTAEAYSKWYTLYLLHPDGTVEEVTKNYDMDEPKYEVGCTRIDHNFHPEIFNKMAGLHDWYICPLALEVAAGRWALEYCEDFDSARYYPNKPEECK